MRALILLPLLLLSISCASEPPVIKTEVIKLTPPATLLAPCAAPTLQGDTYRAIIGHALDLKRALKHCDADKAALRQWANDP